MLCKQLEIFLLGILFLAGTARPAAAREKSLAGLLRTYGLEMQGASAFQVATDLPREGKSHRFRTVIAERGPERLELEIQEPLTEAEGKERIRLETAVILNLYAPSITPYEGEVSEIVSCPKEMQPVVRTVRFLSRETKLVLASATSRFTFGACEDRQVAYRGAFAAIYDPATRRLFQVRAFIRKSAEPFAKIDSRLESLIGSLRLIHKE